MSLHRAQECLSVPQEREGLPGTDPIVVSLPPSSDDLATSSVFVPSIFSSYRGNSNLH